MDILSITPHEVAVDVLHPGTRRPIGLKVKLRSNQTAEVRSASEAYLEKSRAAERRGKPLSVQEVRAESIKITAAAITGWEWTGEASLNGKKPNYSAEAAREIAGVDWIRTQLDAQLQAEQDFFTD